jgi:MYXO-CTERM domain-containing protein
MRLVRWGIVVSLMAIAAPVGAYVRTRTEVTRVPVRWPSPTVTVSIPATGLPGTVSPERLRHAVEGAIAAWNQPSAACSTASLRLAATPAPHDRVAQDGINNVIFRRGLWCRNGESGQSCYDREMQALTSVFLRNHPGQPDDGEIVEADIELNAVHVRWAALDPPPAVFPPGVADLQTVLTHELGHVLGLAHTCDEGLVYPPLEDNQGRKVERCRRGETRGTVMYPERGSGPAVRRALSSDEIDAVCDIYPNGRPRKRGCFASVGGAATSSPSLVLAALALFAAALRRRTSRS